MIFKYINKNDSNGVIEIEADNPWKSRQILKNNIKGSCSKSKNWILEKNY